MFLFSGTLLLWSSFQIFIVLGQRDISLEAVSSYGIPEEPLITSETENERQAEEEHGGGGHHHHHHGNPLDWLRESVPGTNTNTPLMSLMQSKNANSLTNENYFEFFCR